MQTQSYPKGGLLDGLCPASSAPSTLGPEQDFQMFPKARISTVSVNYCSVGQDFPAGSLNLLSSASGKTQAPERASRWGWGCDFPGPRSDRDLSFLISWPMLCPWGRSRTGLPGHGHSSDAQRAYSSHASCSGPGPGGVGEPAEFLLLWPESSTHPVGCWGRQCRQVTGCLGGGENAYSQVLQ